MTRSIRVFAFSVFIPIALAASSPASASWSAGGLFINSLTQPGTKISFDFTGDNAGGIFMNWGAVLQRISPDGQLLLGPSGVTMALGTSSVAACVADGSGGIFVASYVSNNVRVARVNAPGNVIWNVVAGSTATAKSNIHVSPDGTGGALVAWSEARALPAPDDHKMAYCQRVNGAGNVLWSATGVLVRKTRWTPPCQGGCPPDAGVDVIVTDICEGTPAGIAGGGFVVTYEDPPHPYSNIARMTITAVSSVGAVVGTNGALAPPMFAIPDGQGGAYTSIFPATFAYIAGGSFDLAHTQDIYRFSQNVSSGWSVTLGAPSNTRHGASIARTPSGVVAAWIQDSDVYAQKVTSDGVSLWPASGVPVCTVANDQSEAFVATDFIGGAYVAWSDARYGQKDIYLQHLDSNGSATLVGDQGIPVTSQVGDETHTTLYSNPAGYTIVMWKGADGNYALRLNGGTVAGVGLPTLSSALEQNHPNPFNPATTIGFTLEKAGRATLDIYAVDGRHIRNLLDEHRGAGLHRVTWDGTDRRAQPVSSGVYLYRLRADKFAQTRKMLLVK